MRLIVLARLSAAAAVLTGCGSGDAIEEAAPAAGAATEGYDATSTTTDPGYGPGFSNPYPGSAVPPATGTGPAPDAAVDVGTGVSPRPPSTTSTERPAAPATQ